jgi:hypothetical protein
VTDAKVELRLPEGIRKEPPLLRKGVVHAVRYVKADNQIVPHKTQTNSGSYANL